MGVPQHRAKRPSAAETGRAREVEGLADDEIATAFKGCCSNWGRFWERPAKVSIADFARELERAFAAKNGLKIKEQSNG